MNRVRLDHLAIHADDIGEIVGYFHSTPIRAWDPRGTTAREAADSRKRIVYAKENQ